MVRDGPALGPLDCAQPVFSMTVCHHEHLSPDCNPNDFKHRACSGDAWCVDLDQGVDCDCPHHFADAQELAPEK